MDDLQFGHIKKRIIDAEFSRLNEVQREAVYNINGPMLILAGAGSGKTTVLVNKIGYMVKYGDAYNSRFKPAQISESDMQTLSDYAQNPASEQAQRVRELISVQPVAPWNILAITFTNKAANELKERLARMVEGGSEVWASTFHACCMKILRRDSEKIGIAGGFTIYDTDDSKKVIRECMKALNIPEKNFPVGALLSAIGRAKDALMTPGDFRERAGADFRLQTIAKVYEMYQSRLRAYSAMDFDDIIFNTVRLISECEEVRNYYQNKFKYIFVDEYQDTNYAQYRLISLLAEKWRNLCVVGDDDQSIYKFRGATIENILNFEKQYDDAKVIRLEQNYRSTKLILDSANHAIKKNENRKGKTLWTDNEQGARIKCYCAEDEYGEGAFIAQSVLEEIKKSDRKYGDFAVLYRANAQSSAIESALLKNGIPYKVFSGLKFYERAEIKDLSSYLCVIANPDDGLRLKRIVNTPKRGIGDTTVAACEAVAQNTGKSLYEIMSTASSYFQLERAAAKLSEFIAVIDRLRSSAADQSLSEFVKTVLEQTGYLAYVTALDNEDGRDRLANIETYLSNVENYEENAQEPTLAGYLEEVSLSTELDNLSEDESYVALMTLHSAKGLEFPVVFIAGMEEEVFPSTHAVLDPTELEEERRLAYVGITRAKQQLYLTYAGQRRSFQGLRFHKPSRFLSDIPETNLEMIGLTSKKAKPSSSAWQSKKSFGGAPASDMLQRTASKKLPDMQSLCAGDQVHHGTFGDGLVLKATPVGGDLMVEVAFDSVGTKKLMANYAKLTKMAN